MRVLSETKLALCACGNYSPDTFRLYEALEAGALPIVEDEGGLQAWREAFWPPSLLRTTPWKDRYWRVIARKMTRPSYWRNAYGDAFPCPTLCHWENLGELVKRLDIAEVSESVAVWWREEKDRTRAAVTEAVRGKLIEPR